MMDPATFVGTAAALIVVAAVASVIPAWRATQIDPVRALRGE
jgi:ABC-type lipoprotein release transport system permease subunit